jgi:hypothetical protein
MGDKQACFQRKVDMIEYVKGFLNQYNEKNSSNTPPGSEGNIAPTILFNEGWMVRVLVAVSIEYRINLEHVSFSDNPCWFSEGLLPSPFLSDKVQRGCGESHTHADMIIGDIKFDQKFECPKGGEVSLEKSAQTFGVIEAKMNSPLSMGTTNAPNYCQTSRNVACIAHMTKDIPTCKHTFFGVVAPECKIESIRPLVEKEFMTQQIAERFEKCVFRKEEPYEAILAQVRKCASFTISYEEWIEKFKAFSSIHDALDTFRKNCYRFNRIRVEPEDQKR